MSLSHPRTGRARHLFAALALGAAPILTLGCEGSKTPAPAGGSSTANAQPAAQTPANGAPAAAARPGTDGAKEAGSAVKAPAPDAGKTAAAPGQTPVQDASAQSKEAAAVAAAKAQQDAAKAAAAAATALPPGHSEHDGHDHGNAGKAPAFDPNNPEAPPDPNSKAKLTFEFGTDSKSFGKVLQGDVLNHVFSMTSSGEEDLVIKQAKPTCGCTVAQITAQQADGSMAPYAFGNPIPVGRKVEIKATLHTVNKRGHAGSRINVFSNDPRGQTQLALEAEVEPFFNINPVVINFNTLSAKDAAKDKASITTVGGKRVKLNAFLDNIPQGLKVELKPLDADESGAATRWDLDVTAGPGLVEGNLAYMVPLKSDLAIPGAEKLPNGSAPTYEQSITIMGRVTGMLEYNPAFVSLGLIRPGQAQSRTIRMLSHDASFKFEGLKAVVQGRDVPEWEYAQYFDTIVRPVANESAVDIEVALKGMPESLNGSFSGMLVIQTGYPGKPEVKLPITGVCRGGAVVPAAGQPK